MPVIGRAGAHPLTEKLGEDPFGVLYRGVQLREGGFHRHLLVRVFSEELRRAGLGARLQSAQAALVKLGELKAYERYRLEDGEFPTATSPYLAGRSLAEVLDRIRKGAAPMPMDSGLALIFSLAHEVSKLRGQGFHHGLLNPHTVWVGFDGQLHVLDAPLAAAFHELLPAAPSLRAALQAYDPPAHLDEARRDLWQLGALAYELLTHHALPLADARQLARREAVERLGEGADGREPLPPDLKRMLHRMLGTEGGFASIEAFERDMERVLFDGDHVPTTFGLAFYMHDLFLKETRAEAAAIPAEKEMDFFAHTDAAAALKGRLQDNLALLKEAPLVPPPPPKRKRRLAPAAVAAFALLAAGGGLLAFRSKGDAQVAALKAQVAASERRTAELSVQQSDLDQRKLEEAKARARTEAQLAEVRTAAAQAELQRQLEETRKRQAALDRQQADLATEQRRLAEARQSYERRAAPAAAPVPPPVASAPAPPADASPRLLAPVTGGLPMGFRGDGSPVKVRVFINEQGRAQKAMVLGGDPALAEIAKAAAMAGTYAPAVHAGAPSRDWVTVSVLFVR